MKTRTDVLFDAIEAYLRPAITALVDQWNAACPELGLPDIAEWDRGYRDVMTGLREYPAVILIERKRAEVDSFTMAYSMVIGFAYTCPEPDILQSHGDVYKDILEDVVRADWHLGGACLNVRNLELDSTVIGGVFVASVSIDVDVDKGGFL